MIGMLDREEKDFYELHIIVSNSYENPVNSDDNLSSAIVYIDVLDVLVFF